MLKTELEEAKRYVSTDSIQISIGEIATMYSQEELDVIPEFQRLFRWSINKKSDFIESILIGIPVPPAFAFENSNGTWELVDGLQRISTILEFMGILRDVDNPGATLPPSTLTSSHYLPSLNGICYNQAGADSTPLEKSLQIFFRRARLDFQVLKHPSDPKTKFDLFRRLNRGGEYANPQEVRTCSMVLGNAEATKKIRNLAESEKFLSLVKLDDKKRLEQKHVEYLVRAIVHTGIDFESETDVQDFLDKGILKIIVDQNPDSILDKIKWTIEILYEALGDTALIRKRSSNHVIFNHPEIP